MAWTKTKEITANISDTCYCVRLERTGDRIVASMEVDCGTSIDSVSVELGEDEFDSISLVLKTIRDNLLGELGYSEEVE